MGDQFDDRERMSPFFPTNSNGRVLKDLQSQLAPALAGIGVELSFQQNCSFERQGNTLIATTPHSFKEYESEVLLIPSVDSYVGAEAKF